MNGPSEEIRDIINRHLKPTTHDHLRSVDSVRGTKPLEDSLVAYCQGIEYAQLRERGVEEYLALRYADDPIEAFNLFIKAWVPEKYHAHLLDDDENDGEFVRGHIRRSAVPA